MADTLRRQEVRKLRADAERRMADGVVEHLPGIAVPTVRVLDIDTKQRLLLHARAMGASLAEACDSIGICTRTAWRWRRTDRWFAEEWKAASALAAQAIEAALTAGALKVANDPRYTNAALAILRANDPEGRWADRRDLRMTGLVAHVNADEVLASDLATLAAKLSGKQAALPAAEAQPPDAGTPPELEADGQP